jgi:hypothetical protein
MKEAERMKELGLFITRGGNSYEGFFYQEDKVVKLYGPLTTVEHCDSSSHCREFSAISEDDARQIINNAIEDCELK